MASPDRRFLVLVLCVLMITSCLFLIRFLQLVAGGGAVLFEDLEFFTMAAQKLSEGRIGELYSLDAIRKYFAVMGGDRPFVYPPVMLFFVWPLTLAPSSFAPAVWLIPHLIFWMAALAIHRFPRPKVIIIALAMPSLVVAALFGQTGLLTAGLLIAGVSLLPKRPILAGICFGCMVIKPHLALLVPVALVAGKYWRTMASAVLTALVLIALSAVVWGGQLWIQYTHVIKVHAEIVASAPSVLITVMVSLYGMLRQLGVEHGEALALQSIASIAAVYAVWRVFAGPATPALRTSVFLVATIIASPYVFVYDLPILIVPLLFIADRALGQGMTGGERKMLVLAGFLPLVTVQLNRMGVPIAAPAILALFALFFSKIGKEA